MMTMGRNCSMGSSSIWADRWIFIYQQNWVLLIRALSQYPRWLRPLDSQRRMWLNIFSRNRNRFDMNLIFMQSSWGAFSWTIRDCSGGYSAPVDAAVQSLHRRCPCCKKGKLITLENFDGRGPPACVIGGAQKTLTCAVM